MSVLIAPPSFEGDVNKTRAAQLNRTVLLFTLVTVCLIVPAYPLFAPDQAQRLLLIAPLAPLMLFLLWLNRRGHVNAAAYLFSGAIWLYMVVAGATSGGVRTPAFMFTILPVIFAGFLLGPMSGLIFAALTILAGLGLLLTDEAGLLPPPINFSATALWVLQSIAIFTAALILHLARRNLEESLERAERGERALLRQNETLRLQAQLLDSVNESIVSTDLQGRVVFWGQGAEKLYGLREAETSGRVFSTLIDPEDEASDAGRFQLVLRQGQWHGECRQRRHDGDVFWAETSMSLVADADGQALGVISIDRDISERHLVEISLRRSLADAAHNQRLLLALSEVGQAVQRGGSTTEIYRLVGNEIAALGYHASILELTADHQALRIAHHTFDPARLHQTQELMGLQLETFRVALGSTTLLHRLVAERQAIFEPITSAAIVAVLPESLQPFAQQLATILDLREAIGAPIVVGGALHGLLFMVGGELQKGDVPAVTVLANQIGVAVEQAQLMQAIKEQAERLQRILDAVPEGIVVLDAAQRIQMTNPMGQTQIRQLSQVSVGEKLERMNDLPLGPLLQTTSDKLSWRELTVAESGRTYELASMRLALNLQPTGWILILRDVTDERTRQRYQQAQERLATVGQLAAGVAHDFNNIMAIITLYAQLLLRTPDLTPTASDRLSTIQHQADRAASLISQILDFSRRAVLEFAPIALVPFLKELLKLLERTFPENIRFQLETDDSRDLVHADPGRLQQVFLNLTVNARDAMPRGGSILIRVEHTLLPPGGAPPLPGMQPGDWMRISLTDNGAGIAPDDLPHVFEPFFSTKPIGQGTGLGLAQAYGIVKQHGGHIDVSSTPGKGTTFTIYLPAMLLTEASAPEPEASITSPHAGDNQLILVVEDDPAARRAVCDAVATLGYRVLEAEDGAAAIRIHAQHGAEIALVLSDLVMPDLGGDAIFRALQRQRPGIKMILMSGYPRRESDPPLHAMGAAGWIAKPFTLQEIGAAIQTALAG